MNLEGNVAFDATAERIYGPHKNLLVVYIRGLFSSWKQPIYFGYDDKLDVNRINEVLTEIHNIGLDVVAMVCDNAGGNRGIWTSLKVTYENPQFDHPVTGKPIFCISDPPHLIKLLRNNLLDYGFELKDGTQILASDFRWLLSVDSCEFKSCHKLTQRHVKVIKSDRQNVRMAFETISASVAEGFRSYLSNRQRQGDFIQLANDAFDVLNSSVTHNSNHLKCSFGIFFTRQTEVLNAFFEEVESLKVMSGRPMKHFLFQKGILMTINALKGLYAHMKAELGIQYINVNRLNQDIAENAFGIMRGMGVFKQNPDCVDAKYRLRMLAICWHLLKPSRHSSVGEDCEDHGKTIFGKKLLPLMQSSPLPISPISEEVENAISELTSLENELSQVNFQEYVDALSPTEQAEFGGMEFLSGYIVRKLKSKFPDLHLDEETENEAGLDSWTRRVSLGNLTVPSLDFLNLVRKWEPNFDAVHGQDPTSTFRNKLNRNFGVITLLTARIRDDFPDSPEELVKYYVKVRTFIRIKDVNTKIQQWRFSQRNFRKARQFAQGAFPNPGNSETDSEPE